MRFLVNDSMINIQTNSHTGYSAKEEKAGKKKFIMS